MRFYVWDSAFITINSTISRYFTRSFIQSFILGYQIYKILTFQIYIQILIKNQMKQKLSSLKILQIIVKSLNKTEGRDKLCKMIQYICLSLSYIYKQNDYYSLQFQTLSQSVKDARKIFRLFKSIIQYKKLITILLDDDDNLLKVFRVLGQVCFFFYWFFDNISIAYKIKLFKGNFSKLNRIASIFWLLSLLIMIPVCLIQSLQSKDSKIKQEFLLDSIKYTFDLLPATNDSQIKNRFFQLKINTLLVGIAGFFSGAISSYQNVRFVIDQKDQK